MPDWLRTAIVAVVIAAGGSYIATGIRIAEVSKDVASNRSEAIRVDESSKERAAMARAELAAATERLDDRIDSAVQTLETSRYQGLRSLEGSISRDLVSLEARLNRATDREDPDVRALQERVRALEREVFARRRALQ